MRKSLFEAGYFNKGYVVFEQDSSLWWLRFLKPGFRHCYLLVQLSSQPEKWLEINPMSNQIYVFLHTNPLNLSYICHLQKTTNSHIIAVDFAQAPLKCAPFAPFTCVEFVKRVLGIHKFSVFTPYKLYKYLCNTKK